MRWTIRRTVKSAATPTGDRRSLGPSSTDWLLDTLRRGFTQAGGVNDEDVPPGTAVGDGDSGFFDARGEALALLAKLQSANATSPRSVQNKTPQGSNMNEIIALETFTELYGDQCGSL